MNINLTAIVTATPGNAERVKDLLFQLVAGSTKEEACLKYDLHQSVDDENIFIFHEIWKDAEGLSLHNKQPHIKEFIEKSAAFLAAPLLVYQTNKIN